LLIIVGFSIVHFRTESQLRSLVDEDSIRLHQISGYMGARMATAFNHLQSIYHETETRHAINSSNPDDFRPLEQSLLRLAVRNPLYDQVRWIDENGFEEIRISRGKTGPYVEPRQHLQDKSQRYYFKAANSLLPGDLYASKIDLNVEQGKVELPVKPVLRIATPVMDVKGKRRGIIIINILMAPVFEIIEYLEQTSSTGNYLLLNQQGDLIYGSILMPGNQQNIKTATSFAKIYPAIWHSISTSATGHLELLDGLWTWKRLASFDNLIGFQKEKTAGKSAVARPITGEFSLIFVVQRPLSFLLEMRRHIRVSTFTGVFVALAIYGIALFLYLSGMYRARRAELEATYARAYASNMTRLKEHEERFRRLVESSSVGQLVVDNEGKIEISNATVEQMLGYERHELTGSPVEILLPADKQRSHVALREEFMVNPRPRKMGEGRKLEARRKDGTTIPVEVGLNPYTDHNRKLVLVNIIDLSHQKLPA
jgi:PAS domain S-box-containing protein